MLKLFLLLLACHTRPTIQNTEDSWNEISSPVPHYRCYEYVRYVTMSYDNKIEGVMCFPKKTYELLDM